MSNPVFPNTTNTRLWPFGSVREVEVVEVISKPGALVAAVICATGIEQFILELRPELVGHTRAGARGQITFRPGGPALGYWDFQQRWELRT